MKINPNLLRYLVGFILGSFIIIAYNNKPSAYIIAVIIALLLYIYKDLQNKDDSYI